jgi:hypothetical protein
MIRRAIVNELHKLPRKNFPRRKVVIKAIDESYQCDLIDLNTYSSTNKGFKYIAVLIDVFTKFIWVKALKTKVRLNELHSIWKRLKAFYF